MEENKYLQSDKQYNYLKEEYGKTQNEYIRENNKMLKYICVLLTINTIGIILLLSPLAMWLINITN